MNPALDAPSPRRRAWPVLLLSALVLVLGLQLMLDRQRPRELAPGAAAPQPASGASAALAAASSAPPASAPEPQWGQAGEAAARVARAASAALATARAAAGLPAAPPAEFVVDLCGVGRLSLPPTEGGAGPADPAAIWARLPASMGETARQQALPRVLAALAAPGQPERARAAAALWVALGPAPAIGATTPTAAPAQATRTLARLARNSRDPTVRVWALAACSRETAASAECRRLPPRDLARLAPQDGLHWLRLAAAPGTSAAARVEALQRAGQADRFGGSGAALAQAVDAAWPDELPGYLRLQLLREAHALETAIQRPALETALNLCTAQALAEAGPRQACEALARRMLQQPGDLAVLETAELLGARLGWPEAERQALANEQAALTRATAWSSPADQPLACGVLEDTRQWLGLVAAEGEVQAARRRLAAQPTASRPAASRP